MNRSIGDTLVTDDDSPFQSKGVVDWVFRDLRASLSKPKVIAMKTNDDSPGEVGILAVLNVHGETTAHDLRQAMGWMSVPAFYSLMAELIDNGKVTCRTEKREVDGVFVEILYYKQNTVTVTHD